MLLSRRCGNCVARSNWQYARAIAHSGGMLSSALQPASVSWNSPPRGSGMAPAPISLQTRQYIYLPVSWDEFQERTKRWLLTAQPRTVRVKLAMQVFQSKSRLAGNQIMGQYQDGKAQVLKQYISVRQIYRTRRFRGRVRRRQRWNRLIYQVRAAPNTNAATPSPSPATAVMSNSSTKRPTKSRWRDRMRLYVKDRIKKARASYYQQVKLYEYSRPEWFDQATGRPLTSRDATGRFVNPWLSQSTNGVQSISAILAWRVIRMMRNVQQTGIFASLVPRLAWTPDPILDKHAENDLPLPIPNQDHSIQFTWIGHSTCWLQMSPRYLAKARKTGSEDWTIISDPIFSLRASPYQNVPIGVPRELPPSHSIDTLVQHCQTLQQLNLDGNNNDSIPNKSDGPNGSTPKARIDVCCISHDHYDHLDEDSVTQLRDHVSLWVVPLGIQEWLVKQCQIPSDRIVELEWWQQAKLRKRPTQDGQFSIELVSKHSKLNPKDGASAASQKSVDECLLTVTCCPAQHWASRTMTDRNYRLWCSFALEVGRDMDPLSKSSFFFCGDTAYPQNNFPLFRQIGDAFGGFDLAAVPIGAYEPSFMMQDAHVDPSEAIRIHKDIRARRSVGIHWGTFALSEEAMDEPPQVLKAHLDKEPHSLDFVAIEPGQTLAVAPKSRSAKPEKDEFIIFDDAAAMDETMGFQNN